MAPILGIYASQISGHLIPPSSFESIATITPTAGTNNITFSSIPSTYKHLQIRCMIRGNYSGGAGPYAGSCDITFNSDTGANYADHRLFGDGSSASGQGYGGTSTINRNNIVYTYGTSTANIFGVSITDILDYSSSVKNKTVRSISGINLNASSSQQQINLSSGLWISTSAINTININVQGGAYAGTAAGSTFALYGIK